MLKEFLTAIFDGISRWEWGSVSDIVGAIANILMAFAALWGVKTANNWIDSKANKAADDVFEEIHSLFGKYLKVYNMVLTCYETVCCMYGSHNKLNPSPFIPYIEIRAVSEKSSFCYELLSPFKDKIRRSLAVQTKYYDGAGPIDFIKLLVKHDEFFEETMSFLKSTRRIIAQQHLELNNEMFEKYKSQFGEFERMYDSISDASHKIKSMKISEIFKID